MRNEWDVYVRESGDLYTYNNGILRPNDSMELPTISTSTTVTLVDGSRGHITPETKSNKEAITFIWYLVDDSIITQIEDYINNDEYLKIVTHVSGREFIGKFTSIKPKWLVGEEPDLYDVEAIFERYE